MLTKQRKRWRGEPLVRSLLGDVATLLAESGGVMSTGELADAMLARRGTSLTDFHARRALAGAAVRAAVEIDPVRGEARLLTRRHGDRVMVALEATSDDGPDTPAAPALLDYADALGAAADRLAAQDLLPTLGTGLREVRPWVAQWHNDFDPVYAGTPAEFFAGFLNQTADRLGLTDDALSAWRPPAAGRGRKKA